MAPTPQKKAGKTFQVKVSTADPSRAGHPQQMLAWTCWLGQGDMLGWLGHVFAGVGSDPSTRTDGDSGPCANLCRREGHSVRFNCGGRRCKKSSG